MPVDPLTQESIPQVSIITPCFNASRFIAETIASVQAQTFGEWEMLLADDVSSDQTVEVIETLGEMDPRIRLIRRTENGGPAVARNSALAEARGRFVAFLDHDDLWLPEKLERQLAFMTRMDCAISYSAFRRRTEAGDGKLITVPSEMTYRSLLKNTAIANLTAMVDQEKTGPIRVPEMPYDDYVLWLALLKKGHRACGLNEDLARFRVVPGSASSQKTHAAHWVWKIYRETEQLGFLDAAWCLSHYGLRALFKRFG